MPPRVPISPLRYPGGKTRFVPHLVSWVGTRRFLRVVEPFCGGASVSLGLLDAGVVEAAVLSDADTVVAAFWKECAYNADEFCARIADEPVTVARWRHWKDVVAADEAGESVSNSDRAMAALFLNRTSFSGLIRHGSVLGGVDQDAKAAAGHPVKYPVGCRFNKDAIIASITRIGAWADQGRLWAFRRDCDSALDTCMEFDFLYLDPPYVEKSDQLYGLGFTETDHRNLAKQVLDLRGVQFGVSYDDMPIIRECYPEKDGVRVLSPKWSYGMGKSKSSREVFVTNIPSDPNSPEFA